MFRSRASLLVLALAGATLLAAADLPMAEDPSLEERNRRLLAKWQNDPEHLQRLRRDLAAFRTLPSHRQQQLRKLDADLHSLEPAVQQRLWNTAERFADWWTDLADADRQFIAAAMSRAEKLSRIREVRDRQWVERLPRREQEELARLPEAERATAVQERQAEERRRHQSWMRVLRSRPETSARAPSNVGRPMRLIDFPPDVQKFVHEQLQPMLNPEERESLANAEGGWPGLALLVRDLSQRHPVLPPANAQPGVTRYQDLPAAVRNLLPRKQLTVGRQWQILHRKEGRWPDFALLVTELLRREGKTSPIALGASRPSEFAPPIQKVLAEQLVPRLKDDEADRLKEAVGKWPEYPLLLHELARAHRVLLPGMTLPGPPELWDAAREALPDVPDRILRDFAIGELTAEERARLRISLADPNSRDRLKAEFFRKHPNEIKRWRKGQPER